jgi:DNA-directed RNA polymerase specialized sigma24 family protein
MKKLASEVILKEAFLKFAAPEKRHYNPSTEEGEEVARTLEEKDQAGSKRDKFKSKQLRSYDRAGVGKWIGDLVKQRTNSDWVYRSPDRQHQNWGQLVGQVQGKLVSKYYKMDANSLKDVMQESLIRAQDKSRKSNIYKLFQDYEAKKKKTPIEGWIHRLLVSRAEDYIRSPDGRKLLYSLKNLNPFMADISNRVEEAFHVKYSNLPAEAKKKKLQELLHDGTITYDEPMLVDGKEVIKEHKIKGLWDAAKAAAKQGVSFDGIITNIKGYKGSDEWKDHFIDNLNKISATHGQVGESTLLSLDADSDSAGSTSQKGLHSRTGDEAALDPAKILEHKEGDKEIPETMYALIESQGGNKNTQERSKFIFDLVWQGYGATEIVDKFSQHESNEGKSKGSVAQQYDKAMHYLKSIIAMTMRTQGGKDEHGNQLPDQHPTLLKEYLTDTVKGKLFAKKLKDLEAHGRSFPVPKEHQNIKAPKYTPYDKKDIKPL